MCTLFRQKLTTALLEPVVGRENISWSNLHERMLPTGRGSNPQPPDHQSDAHPTVSLNIMSPPLSEVGWGHTVFGMDPVGVGVKLLVRSVTWIPFGIHCRSNISRSLGSKVCYCDINGAGYVQTCTMCMFNGMYNTRLDCRCGSLLRHHW